MNHQPQSREVNHRLTQRQAPQATQWRQGSTYREPRNFQKAEADEQRRRGHYRGPHEHTREQLH
jgi:hypothetical protein